MTELIAQIIAFVGLVVGGFATKKYVEHKNVQKGRQQVKDEINEQVIEKIQEAQSNDKVIEAASDSEIDDIADSSSWVRED